MFRFLVNLFTSPIEHSEYENNDFNKWKKRGIR